MNTLKVALRALTTSPFISGVAIVSLALGIGANAAIFSLFDQALLQALPVEEPARLVNLAAPGPKPGSQSCGQAGGCDEVISHPMLRDLQAAETGLASVAGHVSFGANLARDGQATINGQGMLVTGSYFSTLGLQPALGRLLTPSDDQNPGTHFVTVLSWDYWQRELGGDPSVLNRSLIVNGQPMTVVGVAPRGFDGTVLGVKPDLFVPLTMREVMTPGWEGLDDRRVYWIYAFGRLEPGVTLEQASARINNVYSATIRDVEAPLNDGMSARTMERFLAKPLVLTEGRRGQSTLHTEARVPLLLLFGVTGMVLVIACANIANLLLARGAQRGPEMAIRGSLGASRAQLLGQILAESVLLAAIGGAASLVVAWWTMNVIGSLLPPETADVFSMSLDGTVLGFTALLSLGTGLVFGMYPALHATRPDLVTILKNTSGQAAGSRTAVRFRTGLVVGQVALAMTLLVLSGLFIKSLVNVSRVDLGMDPTGLVTFRIAPELNGYSFEESADFFRRVRDELTALPGVSSVSSALVPVLANSSWGTDVAVQGFERGPDIDTNSRFNTVGPGYLATMGMPLVAGREFTATDDAGAPRVAIVNEAFARKFNLAPGQVVGTRMSRSGSDELDIEIVGLMADAKYSEVKDEVPPLHLVPHRQMDEVGSLVFYLRTAGEPGAVMQQVRPVMQRLDGNLPVEDLRTMVEQVRQNTFLDRMIGTLATAFAVLATLLAAVGLYGVLAYNVSRRTREIGLRMALGAESGRVLLLVLRQMGAMALVGGIVGLGVALFAGNAARSLLYGLEGHDPFVIGAAGGVLGVVAALAGVLPARRAARVDPMEALRHE
jgi:predicted permease